MYTLDFETIKQVMQEHRKTGFLYAEVPQGAAGLAEPCRIEIGLKEGTVISCFMIARYGRRFTEQETRQVLTRLGRLNWTFSFQQEASTFLVTPLPPVARSPDTPLPPTAHAYEIASLCLLRTSPPEQRRMRDWTRLHRAVFALADGTKDIAKIAEILSISPELVRRVASDLQSVGAVIFVAQGGPNYS